MNACKHHTVSVRNDAHPALPRKLLALLAVAALDGNAVSADEHDGADGMAPIADYLMDDANEVALARSAAPAVISSRASVRVLRTHGYDTVHDGSNGFVCLVERAWGGQLYYGAAFWDPRIKAPVCYNAHAAQHVLPLYELRTKYALEGKRQAEIGAAIDAAISRGEIRAPTGTAMSYMLSAGQFLHPEIGRWLPHLMIWMPHTTQQDWGDNPVAGPDPVAWRNPGGPFAMVVIPYGEERFIEPDDAAP